MVPGQMHITRMPSCPSIAGERQRHREHATFGTPVRGLSDLALVPGNRRDVHDQAALAVDARFVLGHGAGDVADHVEHARRG